MKERILLNEVFEKSICSKQNELLLDIDESLNWNSFFSLAQSQQVIGMVYCSLKDCIPDEHQQMFKRAYSTELYLYVQRKQMNAEIQQALEGANIPYYYVKGDVICEYYPNPALRTMGDSDLIVHEEDIPKVHDIFISLGYEDKTGGTWERKYSKNGLLWEVHRELCYEEEIGNSEPIVGYFSNSWDMVHDNKIDWNYHFLYMLAHLRKHLINAGVGFRQFMDIAVAVKYSDLDMEWITAEANKMGMGDFFENVLALNYRWFDIKPEGRELIDIDEDFYEYVTDKVFKDGIFGFDNEDNKDALFANQATRNGSVPKGQRIKWMVSRMFPPYDEMKRLDVTSYIDGRPILLPLAWAHRGVNRIFDRKRSRQFISQLTVSNEKIDERIDMFKKWGL